MMENDLKIIKNAKGKSNFKKNMFWSDVMLIIYDLQLL